MGIDTPRPRALVFGRSRDLLAAVPALLSRAGFDVTLMTTQATLRRCRGVARFIHVPHKGELVARASAEARTGYALCVPCDDGTLFDLRHAPLSTEDKLRLLPVSSEAGLSHIASKIGLSQALRAAGVPTPDFDVAQDSAGLARAVAAIGLPAMLKSDFGSGGRQVFACATDAEVAQAAASLAFPVLVQRQLAGTLTDLSAFFHRGEPVTFSCSVSLDLQRQGFGPSVVRTYRPHAEADPRLVAALRRLGRALDANGFVNVSAIVPEPGADPVFFEADMRPNVWVEYPKYFGADPARAIAAAYGLPVPPTPQRQVAIPDTMVLAYLPRMRLIDIALNRYRCRDTFENYARRSILADRLAQSVTRILRGLPRPAKSFLRQLQRLALPAIR